MAMGLARRLKRVGVYLLLFYTFTGAQAAERTPANVILDFIVGGKHAPWYVALRKGFYGKRGWPWLFSRAPGRPTPPQLKNAVTEVFLAPEFDNLGLGFIKPEIMEKTVKVVTEYFDVGRKVTAGEAYTNQCLKRSSD